MRQELMHKKLAYLRPVFLKKNDYPLWTIKLLIKKVEESQKQKETTFCGFEVTTIVKNLNKTLKNVLLNNLTTVITNYKFQIKNETNEKHKKTISFTVQNALNHPVPKTT